MESTSPIVCITSANSGTYTSAELNWTEKKTNLMLTRSLYEAVSLFVKNFECLPDLVFNLWILEFPEKAILPTKTGIWFYSYLVINQTNSLKLMSPSPSWSMTDTISWIIRGTHFCDIGVMLPEITKKIYIEGVSEPLHCFWAQTLSSSSFGSHPKVFITLPNSSSPMLPPPSLRN